MSKLTRTLVLGVTLATLNLAGLTAVAQAQSSDQPTRNQDARRPPSQGQVGEAWRHPQVAAEQSTVADDPRRPPTESQLGESWRHPTSAPVPPAEPNGPSGWLVASLGVLAAALVLAGGLAVLAARRADQQPGRPAASHPGAGRGGLASAAGPSRAAHRRRRRPAAPYREPSGGVLAPPDRRPGAT